MRYILIFLTLFLINCDDGAVSDINAPDPGYYIKIEFKHNNPGETGAFNRSLGNISYRVFDHNSQSLLKSATVDSNIILLRDSVFLGIKKYSFEYSFKDYNNLDFFQLKSQKDTLLNKLREFTSWSIIVKPKTVPHQFTLAGEDTIPSNFDYLKAVLKHKHFLRDSIDSLFFSGKSTNEKNVNIGTYDIVLNMIYKNGMKKDTTLVNQIIKPNNGTQKSIIELKNIIK